MIVRRLRLAAAAAALVTLAGCGSVGGFAGALASFGAGAATGNPIIGISVGIGVKAGVDQTVKYVSRRKQHELQSAIAGVASDLAPGASGAWQHAHLLGSGFDRGEVRVLRLIETPLATCKELLFSVHEDGDHPRVDWFTTTACRNGDSWQWAAAEPAVERWGNLQ